MKAALFGDLVIADDVDGDVVVDVAENIEVDGVECSPARLNAGSGRYPYFFLPGYGQGQHLPGFR